MHFCITGTGRCGTRLLHDLFNVHPEIYVFNETHWIPKMFEFYGTGEAEIASLIDIIHRTHHITGIPVTEIDETSLPIVLSGKKRTTVSEFCNILGNSIAQQHGKKIWADKTPDYGPYLQILQTLWPECRFVHIIRHGGAVASSMALHPGFRWLASAQEMWWVPASFNQYYQVANTVERPLIDFIDLWYWRLLRIRDEANRLKPNSYLEVRFEDLIKQPIQILKKIADFAKVPISDDWLSEAVELIDLDRIHWHEHNMPMDIVEPRHLTLLKHLGYN